MGDGVEKCAKVLTREGARAIGTNCGESDSFEVAQIVAEFSRDTDLPIIAQPNGGKPRLVEGKAVFDSARGVRPRPGGMREKRCAACWRLLRYQPGAYLGNRTDAVPEQLDLVVWAPALNRRPTGASTAPIPAGIRDGDFPAEESGRADFKRKQHLVGAGLFDGAKRDELP